MTLHAVRLPSGGSYCGNSWDIKCLEILYGPSLFRFFRMLYILTKKIIYVVNMKSSSSFPLVTLLSTEYTSPATLSSAWVLPVLVHPSFYDSPLKSSVGVPFMQRAITTNNMNDNVNAATITRARVSLGSFLESF